MEIDEAEDMTSQTSERLMALDFSCAQQQQQNMEQMNTISIRAALGGTVSQAIFINLFMHCELTNYEKLALQALSFGCVVSN